MQQKRQPRPDVLHVLSRCAAPTCMCTPLVTSVLLCTNCAQRRVCWCADLEATLRTADMAVGGAFSLGHDDELQQLPDASQQLPSSSQVCTHEFHCHHGHQEGTVRCTVLDFFKGLT